MNQTPIHLDLPKLLLYVLPLPLVCGAVGAWPMYQHFGMPGIVAVAVAFVIAFAVLFASIAVIKFVVERAQARNQGKTNIAFVLSQAFTTARIANIMAIVVLGLAASYFLNLLQMPFFLWLAGFYMLMLFAETYWLVRTLKSSTPSQD